MCVMPLLLAGVLGAPCKREHLEEYLKTILVQDTSDEPQKCSGEIINAVRFLWSVVNI